MTLLQLIVAFTATWQIVEILHHSVLFESQRARAEVSDGFFNRVFMCPWCLSVWVAAGVYLYIVSIPANMPVLLLPIYAFSLSRLANIGNDLTREFCRTPRQLPLNLPTDNEYEHHP
jgi:hypothetical protein